MAVDMLEAQYLETPDLVAEYVGRRMASARGEVATDAQHGRHCAVVDELRRRGVLR